MDAQTAITTLRDGLGSSDDPISLAWQALDRHMSRAGALPEAWARVGSSGAADHVGMAQGRWADRVSHGTAPAAEGLDHAGRQVWSLRTLNLFKAGEWTPDDTPPPLEGPGCTIHVWRAWAKRQGLRPRGTSGVPEIQALARNAGLLRA